MADKRTLTLTDEVTVTKIKSGKHAGENLYGYVDCDGVKYLSYTKFEAGKADYFVSTLESEWNGEKQVSRWIATEEYKPKGKGGGVYFPNKVDMLGKAMTITAEYINLKLKTPPKTAEELDKMILETLEKVKGWCK